MVLDLIIPHYNEPFSIVKPGLEILKLQCKVDFSKFRVLFINDGEENHLPELEHMDFPFEFKEISIPKSGVSAVRNYGIDHSDAEWVMFCDCDDCFVGIYSMYEILSIIDTKDHDLLWLPYYLDPHGNADRYKVDKFELTFIHGKIFRRSFLNKHQLRFNEKLHYSEDTCFMHVVGMEILPTRIGRVIPNMPLYVYMRRAGSVTEDPSCAYRNMIGLFRRQCSLAEENLKRKRVGTYQVYVLQAMTDAYVALCRSDIQEPRDEFDREVWEFYREQGDILKDAPKKAIDLSVKRSIHEFKMSKETEEQLPEFEIWMKAFALSHSQN